MRLKRVMIAAPGSGNGKTMITCALLQTLKKDGWKVNAFKCGPDYIDPMFHEKAIGVPSKNLDTFFTGEEQTRQLFLDNAKEEGIAVIEGVMGLFDGLGGIREEGSSYHLAKVTRTPIILVADVKGMGRSALALLAGFCAYDKAHLIKGVILNRISKGYYEILKPLIEAELKLPVAGFFPDQKELRIESRYLGLFLPEELKNIRENLEAVSEEFRKTVSLNTVLEIAKNAEELSDNDRRNEKTEELSDHDRRDGETAGNIERPVIAVAKDEAFCFYYEDNLRLLMENGAEIRYFSPLRDRKLPEPCHALLLGGGYPELYAKELSGNVGLRRAVREAFESGIPIVAECGGFMYLHSTITDQEGNTWPMAGVLPADCFYTGRLVRFGYIEIEEAQSHFLKRGERIKGHEFHYYDSTYNGKDALAVKPSTGRSYPCVMEGENYWMGFPHLYYPSNPEFAKRFVEKASKRRFANGAE